MQKLTYLAIALSIVALVVSGVAYQKAGGIEDLKVSLEAAEQKADRLENRLEAEAQERIDAANSQLRLLEAKAEMLKAKAEMESNSDYEAAVAKMESAQEKLAEARETANETLQAQIDELDADIDTLKQEAQGEAVETIDNLQKMLEEWEVELSGSEK